MIPYRGWGGIAQLIRHKRLLASLSSRRTGLGLRQNHVEFTGKIATGTLFGTLRVSPVNINRPIFGLIYHTVWEVVTVLKEHAASFFRARLKYVHLKRW